MEKGSIKNVLNITLRLFIICFASTLVLAFVNNLTKGVIEKNNEKVFSEGCVYVMPQTASTEIIDLTSYGEGLEAARCFDENGELLGIAIKQSIKGYNKGLVLMTGVAKDGNTVTGIKILEHSETPGLGALADSEDFTQQFRGKSYPLATEKNGGEIVAISGATKTTNGILDGGVNKALLIAKEYFKNEGGEA